MLGYFLLIAVWFAVFGGILSDVWADPRSAHRTTINHQTAIIISAVTMCMLAAVLYAFEIKSFNSLSEEESKWWLSVSEIILLLASVLLILGLLGELPESSSWKERIWYKAAKAAVVLGVTWELLSDGGIFVVSARLQGIEGKEISAANVKAADASRVAGEANERAAKLNKDAAELRAALDTEREKTAPRPWTKEQFDAIQAVKGAVGDVGLLWENGCLECELLTQHISVALASAGVRIYGFRETKEREQFATGILVLVPIGSDPYKTPLVVALTKAQLNPVAMHAVEQFSPIRTDIPVIIVGERFPAMLTLPYSPSGVPPWTILPIEKR